MRKRLPLFAPLFLLLAFGATASAQEQEEQDEGPQSNVVAVRYFQCPFHHQSTAVELLNTQFRPIVQELIDEGELIGYGILTHSWGDRWNVSDYFVAEDLVSFHEAFDEAYSRVNERYPEEPDPPFGELCPEHKDNIYFTVPPPEEEESGEESG